MAAISNSQAASYKSVAPLGISAPLLVMWVPTPTCRSYAGGEV